MLGGCGWLAGGVISAAATLAPAAPWRYVRQDPPAVFLIPDRFEAESEAGVDVHLASFDSTGTFPRTSRMVEVDASDVAFDWVFTRSDRVQRNLDESASSDGGRSLTVALPEGGTILIGMEWTDGDRTICAKTILTRGPRDEARASHPVAAAKTGQRAEIRPLTDPRALRAPGEALFEVAFDTIGAAGLTLRARHASLCIVTEATVDANGTVRIGLDRDGVWLVEVRAREEGVNQILIATLSFEIPEFDE